MFDNYESVADDIAKPNKINAKVKAKEPEIETNNEKSIGIKD